ncbi:hypothetical protein QCA50_011581 [Cerrena zonata]|uniref:Ankyrin repeat protein n=1 Tax=Cerrena zonata TaxID=2478898 RepID=A0AAW0G5F8_9APHY
MPGVSRGHRAEAKYNVVLDYPQLGLHSAAVTGNIALVQYALGNGQPINSALDGVLPLHAACSGGNDLVVRLLIDNGADVNAPRLPRRYSNDKCRDNSTPIIGVTGSTPLHFACANGHDRVVMTLLLHGAHPDRPDKHGITPEMLARQNGWVNCADILKEWSFNKDRDLRERENKKSSQPLMSTEEPVSSKQKESHAYCGSLDCTECSTRKRIRVKRSIDNAVRVLKPSHHTSSSVDKQPPSPLGKPLGEYTYYASPDPRVSQELPPRRPSLPHIHDTQSSTSSHRRPSNPQSSISTPSRRPRSAGTDAEPSPSSQRLKGKISLLGIFKKNSNDAYGTPDSQSGSSSVFTSHSPSPAPDLRSAPTGSQSRATDLLASTPPDSSPLNGHGAARIRSRFGSTGESGRQSPPQAVELHHALSRESLRALYDASQTTAESVGTHGTRSTPSRPGILRAHGRSPSSGPSHLQSQSESMRSSNLNQSMPPPPSSAQSSRSLRFDSPSSTSTSYSRRPSETRRDRRHESRSPGRHIRGSESKSSMRSRSPGSPWGIMSRDSDDLPITQSASPTPLLGVDGLNHTPRTGGGIEEEEEENYGKQIEPIVGMNTLTLEDHPLHSSPELTTSDLPSHHTHTRVGESASGGQPRIFDCPFSINLPPVNADEEPQEVISRPNLLGIDGIDGRTRGDSLSSMNTNPTSSSSASAYLGTPAVSSWNLPTPAVYSPPTNIPDLPSPVEREVSRTEFVDPQSPKRPRVPLDIDIRSISSHAQAEALVQQAQQRIFDLQNEMVNPRTNALGVSGGEGRTPLSARLAAYGESLAIERKFKEEEERKRSPKSTNPLAASPLGFTSSRSQGSNSTRPSALRASRSARGLDRTFSLEDKSRVHGRHGRVQKVKRPHTSGGTPVSGTSESMTPPERPNGHHYSMSSSAALGATTPDRDHPSKITPRSPQTFVVAVTPPPTTTSYPIPPPPDRFSLDYNPRPLRSRTPDPYQSTQVRLISLLGLLSHASPPHLPMIRFTILLLAVG